MVASALATPRSTAWSTQRCTPTPAWPGPGTLQQAVALRDVAAAGLSPSLGLAASAQRGTAGGQSTGNRFATGLQAQWTPDVFGANRRALDASTAAAQGSAARLGDVQVQVATEVALNYLLLRSAQARLAIAGDNLDSQAHTLQIADWRRQAGLVSTLDSEQARAATEQTRSLLPARQTAIEQTGHALAVLTGQPRRRWHRCWPPAPPCPLCATRRCWACRPTCCWSAPICAPRATR